MKNSLKGRMACVNWQDGIRITKSLYVCLSQEPQEPETVGPDHGDYIRKQKKDSKKQKSSKVWFHTQSSLARMAGMSLMIGQSC
jgi:hypothetical protein